MAVGLVLFPSIFPLSHIPITSFCTVLYFVFLCYCACIISINRQIALASKSIDLPFLIQTSQFSVLSFQRPAKSDVEEEFLFALDDGGVMDRP